MRLSTVFAPLVVLLFRPATARKQSQLHHPLLADEVCRDEYESELRERIGELEGVLKQIRNLAGHQPGARWRSIVQLVDAAYASPAPEPAAPQSCTLFVPGP